MRVPQKHDFPDVLKKEVFKRTGNSVPNWEIFVRREDNIAWSVVLSFLISTNFRNPDDFVRRLETLIGASEKVKMVKRAIRAFNPFRNRDSCFYDEKLKSVVTEFKKRLTWDSLQNVPDKLSAISKTLECPLLLIWEDKDCVKYRLYSEFGEKKFNMIALHCTEYTDYDNKTQRKQYSFLINNDMGIKLKFISLRYFLKEAKISKKISKKVELLIKKGKHFLISLLHSNHHDVISSLYDSAYIVSKLKEAGFETDPGSKGADGFSALHHALALGKTEILHKLYYFSANNCCQTEGTYRNPNSDIVSNFKQLREILLGDLARLDEHHPEYDKVKKDYDDLLRFNEFLAELSDEILKIKSEFNDCETARKLRLNIKNRKDIVLCVLDKYEKYFEAVPSDLIQKSLFDDYTKHINYYKLIDMETAAIFFTYIILLKERVVLENYTQYSQIEISFYQTIICHKLFHDMRSVNFEDIFLTNDISKFNIFFVPLIRRLDNIKKVTEFSKYLRVTGGKVTENIPQEEVLSIFKRFPIFKNTMHLKRLIKYIDAALKIKVDDEKSVLVIQRALQVIGEYLHTDESNNDTFRRFLLIALPKETCRVLRRIRHELSHVGSDVFKSKFECEKNFSLFRSIQKEIGSISGRFELVYKFYSCIEFSNFWKMVEKDMEEVTKLRASCSISGESLSEFGISGNLFVTLWQRRCFLSCMSSWKTLFETSLSRVESDIMEEVRCTDDRELSKNQVLEIFWPLRWLIDQLAEHELSNRLIMLLKMLEEINTCEEDTYPLKDLQLKTDKFILECKAFLEHLDCIYTSKGRKNPLKRFYNLQPFGHLERFLNILNGVTLLSKAQKKKIRKEIPEKIKLDIITVGKLKKSIHKGFTLNIDEKASEFKISYLSGEKLRRIFDLYNKKSLDILYELEITNPISQLEEIFLKNSVNKENFDSLCEILQLSGETKKLLENLATVQRKRVPENGLQNLHNRIKLLKKILIEDNAEIHNLWLKIKRQTSKKHIADRIVWQYLRNPSYCASFEMLFLDCASVFESLTKSKKKKKSKVQKTLELEGQATGESASQEIRDESCGSNKGIENPWIKTEDLYCGINLRNIISHGNPFLESLCKLLAPDDLAKGNVKKMLRLIEDEEAVKAILDLYKLLDEDYILLQDFLKSKDNTEHSELKNQILMCVDWERYFELLTFNQISSENEKR